MNTDNCYFKTEITNIPVTHLKEIILAEITKLLFDFGQKVVSNDPEFNYLIDETMSTLRNHYPKWRLNYLDECFRRGKLDEYDRGQKVTVKRVQYWMKSYNISLVDKLKSQREDRKYSDADNDRFAANAARFIPIIKFRQANKPHYDADDWTLVKIEATPEYQRWLKTFGAQKHKIEDVMIKKF